MRQINSTTIMVLVVLLLSRGAVASPAENLAEALTYETVSFSDKSQIDYSAFSRLQQFLRVTYPGVFSKLDVEVINDYSLFIRWPGADTSLQPILFTAHLDVVPIEPGTEADWDHPPFAGVVAGGKIYGRGTLDDKQGVIGLLEAAESLLDQGFQPQRTVVFAFGHDEEIGGDEGAGAIANRLRELEMKFAWMVDEGGMIIGDNPLVPGRAMGMINVAEKSYLTLTLSAVGPGGHSSQPPLRSTIGRLSAALARIEQSPFPAQIVPPVDAMLEALGPYAGQPTALLFANLWLTAPLVAGQMVDDPLTQSFVRTTTALTIFHAGVKDNVVPQRAEAKINFRLLPGDSPERVIRDIEAMIDDASIAISYDSWESSAPMAQYPEGGFAVIAEAIRRVYPKAIIAPSLLAGATDTRHYIDEAEDHYRFHGVYMTANQAQSIHGTNEFITIESLEKSIEVAREMIQIGAQP